MNTDDRPIEIQLETAKPKPGKRKIRVRIFIFLVCLAISGAMWLFIELMKDYTTDITYAISFSNVPNDLILVNQADSIITVGVTAQGFELLVAQFMHEKQTIDINLSDLRIRQGVDGYTAFMPASRLLDQVGRQLKYSKSITSIRPDTLLFRFSEVYRKLVPVRPDISYSFAGQYQLSDTIRFSPQSVTVSSIRNVIDTIRFVTTQRVDLHDLDSSLSITVPLKKGLRNNMIRYSSDSVNIKLQVEKFTEAVYNVPVSITGNQLPIRLFPDQVQVTCMVPLNKFKDIEAGSFTAMVVATPEALAGSKYLLVRLTKIPSAVRSVRLKPDHVEYIIIAK